MRVILIPSRPEYIAAGLLPVLWWEKSDFPLFKTAAVSEVISIMQLRNIKNCKDAMRLLYQTDLRPESPETVFESDMEISDSDSTPRSLDDKMSDSSSVDNESPRSCLKQKFHEEKTVKRPISCLAKEERYNHVQRHLHPLAYMCDWRRKRKRVINSTTTATVNNQSHVYLSFDNTTMSYGAFKGLAFILFLGRHTEASFCSILRHNLFPQWLTSQWRGIWHTPLCNSTPPITPLSCLAYFCLLKRHATSSTSVSPSPL